MKIIKSGFVKSPPIAGILIICSKCKCQFQLEESDKASIQYEIRHSTDQRDPGTDLIIKVKCPECETLLTTIKNLDLPVGAGSYRDR